MPASLAAQSTAGWVLWQKVTYSQKVANAPLTSAPTEWEPQDGYERLADCRAAVTAQVQALPKAYKETGAQVEAAANMIVVISPATQQKPLSVMNLTFVCFPGNLDPRPRSGDK